LTLPQAAALLNTSPRTLYRLLEKGKVPGFKLGGQWRVTESELRKWMARQG
jgi:excisionase family DNA binding protein